MRYTISYKKGDIVDIPFPYTDGRGMGRRPSVILSKDEHHITKGHKYVCALITSQEANEDVKRYEHQINNPNSKGLPLDPSWVIVDRIFSTDDEFILRQRGNIGSDLKIIETMFEEIYK